ncbi:hypothetical protein BDZ45DRAFT_754466 [Acephala macrosclerotiorum]|nr:hypothetical protein BDZ45DRAFT_754466 [Acephala macrosclerotiorum]
MPAMSSIKNTWAYQEVARIEALPKADLIHEVHHAMNGHTYSWRAIQRALQDLVDPADALYLEWNSLCGLKRTWDSFSSLTRGRCLEDIEIALCRDLSTKTWDPLRVLLVKMKLILFRAGLEDDKAIPLVCENLDRPSNFEDNLEKRNVHFEEWAKDNVTSEEAPLLQVFPSDPLPRGSRLWWRTWIPFM